MSLDFAAIVFDHTEGADHAYADVLDAVGEAPWTRKIAFVEHHRKDRIVVRGTIAGHYVDIQDESDLIGAKTAEGALAGALVGVLLGPPGLAAGLVTGGAIGGLAQAGEIPHLDGALFDEVRIDVPEGCSAVLIVADSEDVDAMVAAFEGHGGSVVRHHLSPEAVKALAEAVAGSPEAAPPPDAQ